MDPPPISEDSQTPAGAASRRAAGVSLPFSPSLTEIPHGTDRGSGHRRFVTRRMVLVRSSQPTADGFRSVAGWTSHVVWQFNPSQHAAYPTQHLSRGNSAVRHIIQTRASRPSPVFGRHLRSPPPATVVWVRRSGTLALAPAGPSSSSTSA